MKLTKQIKKIYKFEIEFNEHELSMLQATLGLNNLPELTNKSFAEYKVRELADLYNSLIAIFRNA